MITLDDATSALVFLFLVEECRHDQACAGWSRCSSATGHSWNPTPGATAIISVPLKAGGKVSKNQLTQVGRALKQFGIGHIAACSPEARGRGERAFQTLQDCLPKELVPGTAPSRRPTGFLRGVYLPAYNTRFAVPAEEPASVFVEVPEALWRDALAIQEERRVGLSSSPIQGLDAHRRLRDPG